LPNPHPASPRAGLTEPRAIVARIAEDLNDLRREHGSVTQPSLIARGWTPAQLRKHYLAALDEAARTYSEMKGDGRTDYNPDDPQNVLFESFDAGMRRQLANFEEFQGCNFGAPSYPTLEGDA
jgi:hypothetical protein